MQKQSGKQEKQFYKMTGAGNCFIIINYDQENDQQLSKLAEKVCNRQFGIGADGLLVIYPPQYNPYPFQTEKQSVYHMRIFNSDGSHAEMCGNGLRCFCALLVRQNIIRQSEGKLIVTTDSGIKEVQVSQGSVIVFIKKLSTDEIVKEIGKKFQTFINANINFISPKGQWPEYYVKTYERGAGLTLACGTGVCASFVASIFTGNIDKQSSFQTKGGILTISLDQKGQVWMKGPSLYICKGVLSSHFLTQGRE